MMEIQHMVRTNSHAECVLYEDHVAAMQADLPQPKFKDGDRVTWKRMQGSRIVESSIFRPYNNKYEYYIEGPGELYLWEDELELYAPPVTTCGCPGGYPKVAEVPTSARPERKFKIGNQVTHRDSEKVRKIKNYYFSSEDNEWKYDIGFYYVESELTFYIPPTPAELIPTLVEHEWVRGTTVTGESFEGYVIFNNGNTFGGVRILGFDYSTSPGYIKTLERCDPPEVK